MSGDTNGQWPTLERRNTTEFELWKSHVDGRLDKQDQALQEIRDLLGASKVGLAFIKTMVGLGAGIATIASIVYLIIHGKTL